MAAYASSRAAMRSSRTAPLSIRLTETWFRPLENLHACQTRYLRFRGFGLRLYWNSMELYYKDLISEDSSLEKLVDDLMLVVQGAEEFAQAAGANLNGPGKEEIRSRLARLKERCRNLKRQTVATALAADKVVRQYPYSGLGL